jgi:hypothetical protein
MFDLGFFSDTGLLPKGHVALDRPVPSLASRIPESPSPPEHQNGACSDESSIADSSQATNNAESSGEESDMHRNEPRVRNALDCSARMCSLALVAP